MLDVEREGGLSWAKKVVKKNRARRSPDTGARPEQGREPERQAPMPRVPPGGFLSTIVARDRVERGQVGGDERRQRDRDAAEEPPKAGPNTNPSPKAIPTRPIPRARSSAVVGDVGLRVQIGGRSRRVSGRRTRARLEAKPRSGNSIVTRPAHEDDRPAADPIREPPQTGANRNCISEYEAMMSVMTEARPRTARRNRAGSE
jgi:hypothetical protein